MAGLSEYAIKYKTEHPEASVEEVYGHLVRTVPGCRTTLASVSSMLSRAKRANALVISGGSVLTPTPNVEVVEDTETDEEIRQRINVRYAALARLSRKAVAGLMPSLIVSGPPGMSKSYTVMKAIMESGRQRHDGMSDVMGGGPCNIEGIEANAGWYDHISGSITAVGLFHALWNMRSGGLLFIDDCDDIFRDETSLNLLKIATDSTRERIVSWRKHAAWLEEYGVDKTFDFQGHLIFLTNVDFERIISAHSQQAEHFKALIDRSLYLCLTLRTRRDFIIRIGDVALGKQGMLSQPPYELTAHQSFELFEFITDNPERFYNLSLRLLGQAALCMKADPVGWRDDIIATKMRTQ